MHHCPFCKTQLIRGENKEYETGIEHVFNPNQEHFPVRSTWVCDNSDCVAHTAQVWWNCLGEPSMELIKVKVPLPENIHSK